MEEVQLWSTLFLVFLSSYIILQLIFKFKQQNPQQNYAKLPPSPPKLPVIGHLHLLSGAGLLHHALRGVARKYGPVVHLQLGEISSVLVSSPEATKQVLKERDPACADRADKISTKLFSYCHSDLIFTPYGAHWRQMRRIIVSELLSPRNLGAFGLIRQDEMSRLVLSLKSSAGQAVDLTRMTFSMTCSVICRAAFGSVVKDSDELLGLVKKAATMATGLELADLFPSSKLLNLLCLNRYRLRKMHRRADAILEGIVEKHRLKKSGEFGGEDIVDVMLRMQKDGQQLQVPITNDAIKGFIFDTFAAGIESSSDTINWAMAELMKNPMVMAKAQREVREALKGKTSIDMGDVHELKYLKSVVKETLRLHPPLPLIQRQCREECEVNGYTIPIKSRIAVNVWSMGRDPMYWEEPEMFRPERFDDISREFMGNDFEFIPFGAGRRICPALNLGVANVEIPLAQLLYHFDWKFPQGMSADDMDMAEGKGLFGTRKNPIFLVPTCYIPSTQSS